MSKKNKDDKCKVVDSSLLITLLIAFGVWALVIVAVKLLGM